MRNASPLLALCASLALLASAASAAPGDLVVPAHRTRDGHWVPANVPPLSGGTHLSHRPGRGSAAHRLAPAPVHAQSLMPPLLVDAQPIRR